ncbi:MAG: sigma-54 dependent transcriptional regulator [Deltaproteobacteria bacterium]|nr:sigma-54 dependent transcriptional regulator [Deltaproteobacteria bacterium]
MKQVLIVEDDPVLRSSLIECLKEKWVVLEADTAEKALDIVESGRKIDVLVTDQRLPGVDGISLLKVVKQKNPSVYVIVITAFGSVESAVEAMKEGADDFIQKPFSLPELERSIESSLKWNKRQCVPLKDVGVPVVTQNDKMINLLRICELVAPSDCSVLIEGESGVGKEVLARAIHAMSHRHQGPCVIINCGAIPENLLESELFGFEKGAFTGADKRKLGKIEIAHNGTLILDEISELPLPLQVKLLRVLQEKKIERLGGTELIPVDFRLISVTNKNLLSLCKEGKFRWDLFYRINVVPLKVPPLRERKDDIPILLEHFLRKFKKDVRVTDQALIEALVNYDWPGNVRELQNACERASVLLHAGGKLSPEIFFQNDLQSFNVEIETIDIEQISPVIDQLPSSDGKKIILEVGMSLEEVERTLILATLKHTNGNQSKAAEILGVSSRTLRNKLAEYKKFGINIKDFR